MKVLLATQKPFAAAAVAGIREILEGAGHEVVLLEKYADAHQCCCRCRCYDRKI